MASMSQQSKKRPPSEPKLGNGKKTRNDISSGDSPVIVIENKADNAQSISISPDLDELLHPMTEHEFLDQHFRHKAVHITCDQGSNDDYALKRVSDLREAMFGLDPEKILNESSSDNVFVWLVNKNGDKGSMIQSVEIGQVDKAIRLHKSEKHATYCRAPPEVEQNLVASLLKATGKNPSFRIVIFGIAPYDSFDRPWLWTIRSIWRKHDMHGKR